MTAAARPFTNTASSARPTRITRSVITGYVLSGLASLFLAFDPIMKLIHVQAVTDGMRQTGYPDRLAETLGAILLISLIAYIIPRTAVLGAILLTAYLGGAVATQLRVGAPLAGFVLFPVYLGVFVWGGLYLRDARVRALIPFRGSRA